MFKKFTAKSLLVTSVLALACVSSVVMDAHAYRARRQRTYERTRMQPAVVSSDDTIFYVFAVARRDTFPDYHDTFQHVLGSIQFMNR